MSGATSASGEGQERRGGNAASPWRMPAAGWKDVALRAWREAGKDNISLIASGVAFYCFLAMVPLLGAIVLSYGLVADGPTVIKHVQSLTAVMPADAAKLIGEQLLNVVKTSGSKKGIGLLVALVIALYGAMKGAGALVIALNITYDEEDKRGFVARNGLALAITVAAILLAVLAATSVGALGHLDTLFPGAPSFLLILGKLLSFLIMAGAGAAAAASLYRYGPDRDGARWTWLTPGSVLTSVLWLAVTLGFGFYVANFANYGATYGSLSAVIVLLTWLYLSAYILLLGAEFNASLERQTARDTTKGPEQPMGGRGAEAADTVATARDDSFNNKPSPNLSDRSE